MTAPDPDSGSEPQTHAPPVPSWPPDFSWSRGPATLSIGGRLHLDGRLRVDGSPTGDITVRRARATLRLKLFEERIVVEMAPEFGQNPGLADAFADIEMTPWLHLRLGQMIVPISLRRSLSSNELRHPERPVLVESLFNERLVGAKIWGELAGERIVYDIGVYDGPIGERRADDLAVVGRLVVRPIDALVFAGGYRTWPRSAGVPALATLEAFGIVTFFEPAPDLVPSGARHQASASSIFRRGPFELWAELVYDHGDRVHVPEDGTWEWTQWSAIGDFSVVLTGEARVGEGDLEPRRPVLGTTDPGPGAFELAGRYEFIDAGGVLGDRPSGGFSARSLVASGSATEAHIGHGTLTWTLVPGIRALLSYGYARFAPPHRAPLGGERVGPGGDAAVRRPLLKRYRCTPNSCNACSAARRSAARNDLPSPVPSTRVTPSGNCSCTCARQCG